MNKYDERKQLIEKVLEQNQKEASKQLGIDMSIQRLKNACDVGYLMGYLIGSMTPEQEEELKSRLKIK